MRLSEMLDHAQAGEASYLNDFIRRMGAGQEPEDGELANAYDHYLFKRLLYVAAQEAMKDAVRQTAEDMPPIMRKQGVMAMASIARKVTKDRRN